MLCKVCEPLIITLNSTYTFSPWVGMQIDSSSQHFVNVKVWVEMLSLYTITWAFPNVLAIKLENNVLILNTWLFIVSSLDYKLRHIPINVHTLAQERCLIQASIHIYLRVDESGKLWILTFQMMSPLSVQDAHNGPLYVLKTCIWSTYLQSKLIVSKMTVSI